VAAEPSVANGSELPVVHAVSTKPTPPRPHFWEKEQIEDLNGRKRVAAVALPEEKTKELGLLDPRFLRSSFPLVWSILSG
jgi:hypothetical protein